MLLLMCVQTHHACNCEDFKKIQKKAVAENKFILLYFNDDFSFPTNDRNGVPTMRAYQYKDDIRPAMADYLYVCANKSYNAYLLERYQISGFPKLLIVDANGEEVYRFNDPNDSEEFSNAINNFHQLPAVLAAEINNYHKKPSYTFALSVAKKYLDFSTGISASMRNSVYSAEANYIALAEKLLSGKDYDYTEKAQELALVKLFHWAYHKDFSFLKQELEAINPNAFSENNAAIYYFLKYVTAKALHEDFATVEATAKTKTAAFDAFIRKADLILEQHDS